MGNCGVRDTSQYGYKNIYLAGRIEANDWRHDIVKGLRDGTPLKASCQIITYGAFDYWPVLENAIFDNFHYTGPYFVEGDHVSFHGESTHGVKSYDDYEGLFEGYELENEDQLNEPYGGHGPGVLNGLPYTTIVNRCERAIWTSDILFAWIDDLTCYGTIAEIGYAKALNKIVWIAGPRKFRDLAFVYEMADKTVFTKRCPPKDILEALLNEHARRYPNFNSPIERTFWEAWWDHTKNRIFELEPQYPIGKYRVDFAHVPSMTAIELDGFASHSSTEDIANDRRRQRWIEEQGWHVARFGGKEVHGDVENCAREVYKILSRRDGERRKSGR